MNIYWKETKILNGEYVKETFDIIEKARKDLKNLETFNAFNAVCEFGRELSYKANLI